jgi:hypothetical protein
MLRLAGAQRKRNGPNGDLAISRAAGLEVMGQLEFVLKERGLQPRRKFLKMNHGFSRWGVLKLTQCRAGIRLIGLR